MDLIYYVDSAGLCEGNNALRDMGCEECWDKKCSDNASRNLWRLPDRERFLNFLRRAERETWPVCVFWAKTRDGEPEQFSIHDLDSLEERVAQDPAVEEVQDLFHGNGQLSMSD